MDINIFGNGIAVEGLNTTLTFTIELSEPTLVPITYYWSTLNNTAVSGSDYTAVTIPNTLTQAITFGAGERVKTISVIISNDIISELDESFFVNVFSTNLPTTAILLATTLGNITDTLTASTTTILNGVNALVESLTLTGTAAISGTGNANNNTLIGNSGNNTLDGLAGNDNLQGGAGNDTLIGGLGDDILDGGSGTDSLNGGGGNDTYIISDLIDTITGEVDGGGTDTVHASTNYTLAPANLVTGIYLENLTLTGTATTGTGNHLGNLIQGNALANTLNGKDGNDTLIGGSGNDALIGELGHDFLDGGIGNDTLTGGLDNDTYVIDNDLDVINEAAGQGNDTVQVGYKSYSLTNINIENITLSGVLAINATGNSGDNIVKGNNSNNTLDGGAGNDTLDGNGGVDILKGGAGDDTYILDNLGDTVDLIVEAANGGNDTVKVNADYTLGANLENLELLGNGDFSGTGNTLGNTLTGNIGNNYLDGLGGGDLMIGGGGNDTYVVSDSGDQAIENNAVNQGIDTVLVGLTSSYELAETGDRKYIENVTLIGSASSATGNSLANTLLGNEGNDTLNGLASNDILDGGAGNDVLIGGTGNDLYRVIIGEADIITESSTLVSEIDTIEAYYSGLTPTNYALATNVEILKYLGTTAMNIEGNTSNNIITGNIGNDTLSGKDGNDTLYGGLGSDTLDGGIGNDILYGEVGVDKLTGGAGDDIYFTDSALEVLTEVANGGIDEVRSTVSYLLKNDFEKLTLLGTTNINGTGNAANNILVGNTGINTLDGQGGDDILDGFGGDDILLGQVGNDTLYGLVGNDQLYGGLGNDTYFVDNVLDIVFEGLNEGIDLINSSSLSYTLSDNVENLTLISTSVNGTGNNLSNIITGNSGSNILDGSLGNDTMIGGLGNDFYYVDSLNDNIEESSILIPNSGVDTVFATVNNYTLEGRLNVENLTLIGTTITGTGNGSDNRLIGNSSNNTLNGGSGNDFLDGLTGIDTLVGGFGNDKYIVENTSDVVKEDIDAGTDSVFASVSYTLSANVENLNLSGSLDINGTGSTTNNVIGGNAGKNKLDGGGGDDTIFGNEGNDILLGNTGNDLLVGGTGDDLLTGGTGADKFQYNTNKIFAVADIGNDTISDFSQIQSDRLVLGKTTFGLSGAVGSSVLITEYASVTLDSLIGTSTAKIVHSQQSGSISYNANGSTAGLGAGGLIVTTNVMTALSIETLIVG